MRTFFWDFIIMKICIDFSFIRFHFRFLNIFFLYTGSLSNLLLIKLLTLSQISLLFCSNSLSYRKRQAFSFIKISSICTHFLKHNTQRHNFFMIIFFYPIKYSKLFLIKGTLLDTAIHHILRLGFRIGEIYRFSSASISPKVIVSLSIL